MKTNKITTIAILSSLGIALSFLEFALPFFPSFYKLDFSLLPITLLAFLCGPFAAVIACLVVNLFQLLSTTSAGIGQLANFIMGAAFVLPIGIIYSRNKTKKTALFSFLVGILSISIIGSIVNYYILFPFYSKIMPITAIISMVPNATSLWQVVLYATLPFNLLKGTVISIVVFLVYKKISKFIKGEK